MKLLEHFKAMQGMCRAYVEPTGSYTDREGTISKGVGEHYAFANDMIYMLDGPEQREAQEAAEKIDAYHEDWRMDIRAQVGQADEVAKFQKQRADGLESELEDMRAELSAMRDRVAVSESDKKRAIAALDADRVIQNDLRSRLMDSELAYAKLVGYVEALQDGLPAVMVPQQREPYFTRMPDGSSGAASARTWGRGGSSNAPAQAWYHR